MERRQGGRGHQLAVHYSFAGGHAMCGLIGNLLKNANRSFVTCQRCKAIMAQCYA